MESDTLLFEKLLHPFFVIIYASTIVAQDLRSIVRVIEVVAHGEAPRFEREGLYTKQLDVLLFETVLIGEDKRKADREGAKMAHTGSLSRGDHNINVQLIRAEKGGQSYTEGFEQYGIDELERIGNGYGVKMAVARAMKSENNTGGSIAE